MIIWLGLYFLMLNPPNCKLVKGICSCCKEFKVRSFVYPGYCTTTLMGISQYYDENGKYHYYNPNVSNCRFECSNNHVIWESNK